MEDAVRNSPTIADAMRTLGLKPTGSSYLRFKKRIEALGIDTSHILGKGWNIGGRNLRQNSAKHTKTSGKYTKEMLEEAVRGK